MTEPVVYRNISELRLWSRNYRQGDVGAIITSIRTFGFNGALRVWRDNVVIAGNHTLKALQDMQRSQEDAPHGVMVSAAGEWIVACVDVSHLSEDRAKAFAIADNRTTEIADNDDEQLATLLQEIALQDQVLLEATGYDGDDLDALLRDIGALAEPTGDPGAQVDKAEELLAKWGCERGQVWQIGTHRLMCGDSTDADDVARLMAGEKAQICILDPVYGDETSNLFLSNVRAYAESCISLGWGFEISRQILIIGAFDFDYACETGEDLMFAHKPIQRHKTCAYWDFGNGIYNYELHKTLEFSTSICFWQLRAKREDVEAKYSKPTEQFVFFIRLHTRETQCVFDPFTGSGTTLVACEQLGRRGYGMEIEPKYCAVTLERLAGMGLSPELIEQPVAKIKS